VTDTTDNVRYICPGWTDFANAMTDASTVKGTVFNHSILVTSSLCTVSFLC